MRRRRALTGAVLLLAGGIPCAAVAASQPRPLADSICASVGPVTVASQTIGYQIQACVPAP
jgi:hypothetical protein